MSPLVDARSLSVVAVSLKLINLCQNVSNLIFMNFCDQEEVPNLRQKPRLYLGVKKWKNQG